MFSACKLYFSSYTRQDSIAWKGVKSGGRVASCPNQDSNPHGWGRPWDWAPWQRDVRGLKWGQGGPQNHLVQFTLIIIHICLYFFPHSYQIYYIQQGWAMSGPRAKSNPQASVFWPAKWFWDIYSMLQAKYIIQQFYTKPGCEINNYCNVN